MRKLIPITLTGHDAAFELEEDAYQALHRYLQRAESRLKTDPDRQDVLGDFERSIGEKLVGLTTPEKRGISLTEMQGVLNAMGDVDAGNDSPEPVAGSTPLRRRLCRISENQWFAGVCNGLAAYSAIDVEWVRTLFVFLAVFTGGLFILVYLVLMFVLPAVPNYDDWRALNAAAGSEP